MNILDLITSGESKKIEFKEKLQSFDSFVKTIIAFANGGGGHIFIGIEDKTHKVVGISSSDSIDLPDRITNSIFSSCTPSISFETYCAVIENKNILVIEVFPGMLTPYFKKDLGKQAGTYIRIGATTRTADAETIASLERGKLNISYDEELALDKNASFLDLVKLKTDSERLFDKHINDDFFLNFKIIKKENQKTVPTHGGLLLAAKDFEELPCINGAVFKGNAAIDFIDQKDFKGPLYEQVENALKFVKSYIPLAGKISERTRNDRYEIPLIAVKEALVNAVVHRDYSQSGSNIKLAIFGDRVEITSPGALVKSLDLNDITSGRSEIRNKVIAKFFKEAKYIELWGTGIPRIISLCEEYELKKPDFIESGLFFKAIIYRKKSLDLLNCNENEKKILEYLKKHKVIKNKEAQKLLGLSSSGVRKIFDKLTKQNLLQAKGAGKYRVYKLKD